MRAPFLAVLALAASLPVAEPQDTAAVVGLDHVVVVVRDLERAAAQYRRLGFTLKPGRPHANGIRNQHAKFADGTELELLTVPQRTAADATVRRYQTLLAAGDGPASVAFYAPDPAVLSRRLTAAGQVHQGNGPFVSIPRGDRLDYIFFGPRNASPTDRPEHFEHANGSEALVGVSLTGDALVAEQALIETVGGRLDGSAAGEQTRGGRLMRLQEGFVRLLPGKRAPRPIVAVTLRTKSLDAVLRALATGGWPRPTVEQLPHGRRRIVVEPQLAHGIRLLFVTEP